MIYQATKKVTGGKMIRIKIDADDWIDSIRITGDFFLHPEDVLPTLESSLSGMPVGAPAKDYAKQIQNVLTEEQANFVGVTPQDVADTIVEALHRK